MAIQVHTHEQFLEQRSKIGRYATLGGLAIVLGGVVASFQNNILLAYLALIVGFTISNIGAYFTNRWGLDLYKQIGDGLKGFDKRYRLYNYLLPVPHVLLSPYGVTVFLLKNQDGNITGTENGWRQGSSLGRFLRSLSAEALNDPPKELAAQKNKLREFLAGALGDEQIPIEGYIVFTHPRAQVTLSNVKVPVIVSSQQPDGLKQMLRRDKRTPILSDEIYNRVQALFDHYADERLDDAQKGWRFWKR